MSDQLVNERSRSFCMILYPEDPTHVACIELLQSCGYTYGIIFHDKDLDKDDECKKPHYHVLVKFPNPRFRFPVADDLGIKSNYIRACRDVNNYLLYMIHFGFPDKYQYPHDELHGPLQSQLIKLLCDDDEGSRVLQIVRIVDDTKGHCSYRSTLVKCCEAGLYGEFRRLGSGVKYLIDEHNDSVSQSLYL